jgi:hypothetical protein
MFAYYGYQTNNLVTVGPFLISVFIRWPCLIRVFEETPDFYGCFGKDQFADTYTLKYIQDNGSGSLISVSTLVTRESPCLWVGLDNCNRRVFLEIVRLGNFPEKDFYGWEFFFKPSALCDTFINASFSARKKGFQNTPVGEYETVSWYPGEVE